MNSIDFIVLSLGLSVVLCFLVLLAKGKKITANKKYRYLPLFIVALAIFSTLYLNHYSENQLNTLVYRFNELFSRRDIISYDSLSFTKERKNEIIDSLKRVSDEYREILQGLKKQEKIVGSKSNIIPNVQNAIKKTKREIYKIETYNEIINDSIYEKKMKGYTTTNANTLEFRFQPPKDTSSEYLDFIIRFNNENILNKIVIYIEVCKINDDKNMTYIFGQYYKPQKGVNAFRIKNYLKENKTQISIGYFLIREIGKKKFPTYERIVYSLN